MDNRFLKIIIATIILSILAVGNLIRILKNKSVGQPIREEGNKDHYSKAGTPTMGGLAFLITFLLIVFITNSLNNKILFIIFTTIAFGIIGFIDDYEKVMKKENLGLNSKQKLVLQVIIAFVISIWAYFLLDIKANMLYIPFVSNPINISLLYIPIIIFIIVGTVNAVNLTDGLDGLLSSVSIPVFIGIAYMATKINFEVFTSSLIFASALLGFLVYNSNPASVFMGDTGSMAIGGAFVSMMIILNRPIFIIFIGGIYLAEALSVIIQVISYKTRKKRVFLMSPIHHHFELKGYKEPKIVASFTAISVLLTIITITLMR